MSPKDFEDDDNFTRFEILFPARLTSVWVLMYEERRNFREVLCSTVSNEFIIEWFIGVVLINGCSGENPAYAASATAQLAVLLDRHRRVS